MRIVSFILIASLAIFACKNTSNVNAINPEFESLEQNYNADPTEENFTAMLKFLSSLIVDEQDLAQKEKWIKLAIDKCEKADKLDLMKTFGLEMIKLDIQDDQSKSILKTIITDIDAKGKYDISTVLLQGYGKAFPDDDSVKPRIDAIPDSLKQIDAYIKKCAEAIFVNPGERGLNIAATQKYIDLTESYALVNPQDTISPEYLFRAAEMSRALGTPDKSISLYDWVINYFPTHRHAPMSLFLKGFTFENEYKNLDKAKQCYNLFLEKYPKDPISKDVTFLLENLGKSDEEIMKALEKK